MKWAINERKRKNYAIFVVNQELIHESIFHLEVYSHKSRLEN